MDLDGDGIVADVKQSKASETSQKQVDILADIFGGGSSPAQSNQKNDIMNLFNTGPTNTAPNLIQNTPTTNPLNSSTNEIMNLFGSPQNTQSENPLNNLTTPTSGTNVSGMSQV